MKIPFAHIRSERTSSRYMMIFSISLLILIVIATLIYGAYVLAILATSVLFSLIVDGAFAKLRKKPLDPSFLVSPLIFTLLMPPTIPLWIVAIGSAFGTFFAKAIFGGMGKNIFNPAIVGRLFVTISFPAYMATMWLDPKTDVVSTATPLGALNKGGDFIYEVNDLLLGQVPGSLGETFRLGIIVLGILFIIAKVIDWRIPAFYIGGVFTITFIGHLINPEVYKDPFLSILVGGLLFAAFFVATDPVTAPMTGIAKMMYGLGLAIITVVIRNFAAFPEGIMFSIIIMNAIAPLLDDLVITRRYKPAKKGRVA